MRWCCCCGGGGAPSPVLEGVAQAQGRDDCDGAPPGACTWWWWGGWWGGWDVSADARTAATGLSKNKLKSRVRQQQRGTDRRRSCCWHRRPSAIACTAFYRIPPPRLPWASPAVETERSRGSPTPRWLPCRALPGARRPARRATAAAIQPVDGGEVEAERTPSTDEEPPGGAE